MKDASKHSRATNVSIRRSAYYILSAVSKILRFLVRILSAIAGRIDLIRLGHLSFEVRPGDIFIVTYPRSGTSLVQMILYQLTTDGSVDFDHISQHCPWFENSIRNCGKLDTLSSPRRFKSHLRYRWIPKGPCKYVYVARNGKDVAVSYYHFHKSHIGFEGTFSEFFNRFMAGKVPWGSWFDHVADWLSHKEDPNVLFLTYEDLRYDLEGCIREIADFCGFEVELERFPTIVERCTFAFMKEHESKFDPFEQPLGEQRIEPRHFLRKGHVGEWKEYLDSEQETRFEREFRKRLGGLGLRFASDRLID